MYAKCGSVEDAVRVFEGMGQRRNVISWTSVITGLAMHGEGARALGMFDRMVTEGVTPNEVTFVGVLYACGHAGMVEEGRRVFKSMVEEHGIEPRQEHYGCVVDLLGRAKRLDEAHCLVESMPFRPSVVVWGSLLAACRVHGDVELGELAATRLLELDPDHDGAHVLLSNIYAKRRRWEDVKRIREAMKRRRISKERGRSWVELGGEVHEFGAGDESHPRSGEIRAKLGEIVGELRRVGYEPDAKSALIDLEEEEERREAVLGHGEKLAVALGLIEVGRRRSGGGGGGRCVRIVKNLRVCEDCHVFMKLVSGVYGVEVVLRDRSRFHHFRDGVCSCNDFW
ncbi:Pentatricopeptide repeat-containing protein [Acorus gramineus]|uniref:Pentatricopeptide repeat-containing protein n=1 Tax=Acorus gramineus TaxID=55184 RepID=A0AAV9B4A9_ACOGR|nr:Pentatricopeptide repeat-containing protein [Acorus gramineus]